jgi:hypothetical protein
MRASQLVLSTRRLYLFVTLGYNERSRFQWQPDLKRGSAAARLLGLRVRIPPGAWMFVFCESCVLSGRGVYDWPIPRPEESYRVFVYVCLSVCLSVIEEPHRGGVGQLGLSNHKKRQTGHDCK